MKYFLFGLLGLFAWQSTLSQTCDPNQLIMFQIRARDTDSNIGWELNRHHTFYNPSCPSKNTLLIHLVGSFDNPNSTLKFPTVAANNGFHVVSLKYPNGTAAQTACGMSTDPDCYLKFRREILEGIDLSSETDVNASESVYNRLKKLLIYLEEQNPNSGWAQYMNGNEVAWEKVIVSGHSQGGGHAAVIALSKPVKHVLMFASPNDYSEISNGPAPWTLDTHAAADSAYFGFNNTHDDVVNFSDQFQAWSNMGLPAFGDSIKVDAATIPFNYSHQLYTNYDTTGIGGNHSVMILDSKTPVDNSGEPLFAPVWEYMLGVYGGPNDVAETQTETGLISIYPNPTSGIAQINFNRNLNGTVEMVDAYGRTVYTQNVSGSSQIKLELKNMKAGVYFVKVFDKDEEVGTERLVLFSE